MYFVTSFVEGPMCKTSIYFAQTGKEHHLIIISFQVQVGLQSEMGEAVFRQVQVSFPRSQNCQHLPLREVQCDRHHPCLEQVVS